MADLAKIRRELARDVARELEKVARGRSSQLADEGGTRPVRLEINVTIGKAEADSLSGGRRGGSLRDQVERGRERAAPDVEGRVESRRDERNEDDRSLFLRRQAAQQGLAFGANPFAEAGERLQFAGEARFGAVGFQFRQRADALARVGQDPNASAAGRFAGAIGGVASKFGDLASFGTGLVEIMLPRLVSVLKGVLPDELGLDEKVDEVVNPLITKVEEISANINALAPAFTNTAAIARARVRLAGDEAAIGTEQLGRVFEGQRRFNAETERLKKKVNREVSDQVIQSLIERFKKEVGL